MREVKSCLPARAALFYDPMPTVSFHTLGCKLNFAESSSLGRQFIERGYRVVDFGQQADVCVINTCSVTERADRECRQLIRRAVRTSPDPFVIVTGCYAQLQPEEVASIPGVNLVLGAKEKVDLLEYLLRSEASGQTMVYVSPIDTVDNFGPAISGGDRTRAFLKVQDGCDYNCSFCTIPLARGASRSLGIEDCVHQAGQLVTEGFKEITLTGVNVGDYGRSIGSDLLGLLHRLEKVDGLERIRVSSIEPNLLTDEIIDIVAGSSRICSHFHIPLQSGSDEVLKRMRRRYTSQHYADLIARIRARIPDCGIGVDVIVGFPGEGERHFEETHQFLDELTVSYLHVFTYSERTDTPAAGYGNSVPPAVRSHRNNLLRLMGEKKKHAFHRSMVGRIMPVLLESDVANSLREGYTEHYVRVAVPAAGTNANTIVLAEITGFDGDRCAGRLHRKEIAA